MATFVTANGSEGGPDGKSIAELRKTGFIPVGHVASARGQELEDDYIIQGDDVVTVYPKVKGG